MIHWTATASALLRRIRRRYLELKAKSQGKAFFCAALAGRSQFNVCINSDLTVSCNCHDVDGTGHIGDLNRESLDEILSGPTAQRFREELGRGRLPIPQCSRCWDLVTAPKHEAPRMAQKSHLPKFIQVENISVCNLRCASCPRTQIRQLRRKPAMSPDDMQRVAEAIREIGVSAVGFVNLGEPFLSKNVRRELEILRESNPDLVINTSTNGMPIDTDEKREAALLLDKMQISLDGVDQRMAERYQRDIDFEKVHANMRALVEYRDARGLTRPHITWKYLLFRWNDRKEYLRKAIDMARDAGVDEIVFEKTVSPFYGVSWRYYLGLLKDVGDNHSWGIGVTLREHPEPVLEPVC